MPKIRILIADDHPILRAGLRMLINSQNDMEVADEAADGRETIRKAAELRPDIIVMDLSMPAGGGIQAMESIRRSSPRTRILVLSMHGDPAYVRTAMAAGAKGYIPKHAADTELLSGLRAVHRGQTFIDATLAGFLVENAPGHPAGRIQGDPMAALSERERQVLEQLVQGYTNQQIADKLFLSVKTTETYRARLIRKLNLKDRADLVRFGIEHGMLPSPGQLPTAQLS